jgi:hypothetical protein
MASYAEPRTAGKKEGRELNHGVEDSIPHNGP